ncbi:hypothetical protein JQ607_03305 [Bradyrhizobium liaoningense]|uniref:hypothetical protein n=1 Tax=Bradyrhizobium liaoningense TaxID=43992 RepID=UPI001BAC528A|nr:hypothetical protein [Bradyrhizobium liaoningense]MBR0839212.1 hypothetical protein [Bradyrhizobium liaoningense]
MTGLSEIPSRCALLRMAATGRWSLTLMTPVGVFPFASCFNLFTSAVDHGWRARRLYAGFALRGPLRPIGEPGRFHAAFAMMTLLQTLRERANQHFGSGAIEAASLPRTPLQVTRSAQNHAALTY